jgi:hypothetical protein
VTGCDCAAGLVAGFARVGVAVHARPWEPGLCERYEPLDARCPHGVRWTVAPTAAQVLAWTLAGTP